MEVGFDIYSVPSPSYVCDRGKLAANLAILADVQKRAGCKIFLALKGFAMFSLFQQIRVRKWGQIFILDKAFLGVGLTLGLPALSMINI